MEKSPNECRNQRVLRGRNRTIVRSDIAKRTRGTIEALSERLPLSKSEDWNLNDKMKANVETLLTIIAYYHR